MEKHQSEEQQKVKDNQAKIQEILNRAKEEKRAITDSERAIINQIQKEMTEQAVEYMSDSEREQKVIMERLKSESSKISAVQAAEVVKNSKEQKDKVISEAEQQYNETLAQIIKLRDEAGTITAEQADALIKEAIRQKEETILNAEEMHDRIIEEAKAQAGEHIKLVDWETGEVLSKWEVMKNNVTTKAKELKENMFTTWEDVKTNTSQAWDNIQNIVELGAEGVKKLINKLGTALGEIFTGLINSALNWGRNLLQSFIDGIKEKWSVLLDTVRNIADTVADYLGFSSPTKKGPGRFIEEWGANMVKAFADGMNKELASLQMSLGNMALGFSPVLAGGGASAVYTYNTSDNRVINITVQDGEDLLRTLHRLGVRIP